MSDWVTLEDGVYWDGNPRTKILDVRFRIVDIGQDQNSHSATVEWTTQRGAKHTRKMALTILGDRSKCRDWLLSNAIVPVGGVEQFMRFGTDMLRTILADRDPSKVSTSFGWREHDTFILGEREIKANDTYTARLADSISLEMRNSLSPKGSLAAWSDATKLFDDKAYRAHAFTILASFAAPILEIMGVQGCVVSLAGPANTGKTTSMNYALSVWGNPSGLVLAANSTVNSRGAKLKSAKNIPVGIDDLSQMMREINGLMYMVANGKEKSRAKQDGSIVEGGEWCTVLFVATNYAMLDMTRRELGEAERRRVIELEVHEPFPRATAVQLNHVMQENSGVAAQPYIQHLIRNRAQVKQRAMDHWDRICEDGRIPEANRFGTWLIAACRTASEITTQLGIIKFDYEPALKYVTGELSVTGTHTKIELLTQDEMDIKLLEYIETHRVQFNVRQGRKWVHVCPEGLQPLGLFDLDSHDFHIAAQPCRQWFVSAQNISSTDWRVWLQKREINRQTSKMHTDKKVYSSLLYRRFTDRLTFDLTKEPYGLLHQTA